MHIFFSDFLCFDMSLLLLTVTLRGVGGGGYLISIAYCLFFSFCTGICQSNEMCDMFANIF